jgi:hypothetical protein
MKRKLKFIVIYCVLLLPAFVAGAIWGITWGIGEGELRARVENYKIYNVALSHYYDRPEARGIELKDYLKARYYYFASQLSENWLAQTADDYGPPGPTAYLPIDKCCEGTPQEYYQLFKQKKVRFSTPTTQP